MSFATGAALEKEWVDVSNVDNYQTVLSKIKALNPDGGTNLDAGLTYAEYLLKKTTVKDAVKNVIALTDGKPTYFIDTNKDAYGDDGLRYFNRKFLTIDNIEYRVHGTGSSCNAQTFTDTVTSAVAVKNHAKLYTVCFDADETIGVPDSENQISVSEYLRTKIATQPKAGEKFAYDASNAEQLYAEFAKITQSIVSGLNTGTVKDSLPTGITSTDFGGATQFELNDPAQFHKDVKTETVGEKEVTTYTYTKTYTVTIDPETAATAVINGEKYAPLNGKTTLTVSVGSEEKEIPFPIPAGKVTPTTFTVTWKSQDGKTELEKDEKVAKNSKPSFDKADPTKAEDDMYTYTFAGWATEPNKEAGTLEANLPDVTADVTYYAAFSKKLKTYTVTGTINNGGNVTNGNQTVNAGGSSAAMTFTPAAGYKIVSVKEKVGEKETDITGFAETGYTYPVQNNVKAYITVDVKTAKRSDLKYVVEHVEKGNESNVLGTENKTGTLDEVINGEAQKKTFPGFTYDTCSPESITISATEANNVITLYYTRNEYKVTYEYTGDIPTNPAATPVPDEAIYKYNAKVTIAGAPAAVPGYTFEGWKRGTADAEDFKMPDEDVKITGKWTKNANAGYKIEYYLETLTEGTFEKDNNLTISDRTGTIGTTASVMDADKKQITGFTFDADNVNNVLSDTISANGSLTLMLYYKRNSYKVTYQYTGTVTPENATKLPDEATYKYGAEVTVAAAATSADYVFSGWKTTDAQINNEGKFSMPANNVTIRGSWTQATYDVNLSPYVKKTLEVDGTLPTDFSETFKVNVTVDGQPQQQGTVTMTAADTSNFNMPTVALTKGTHTIMVQEVVDDSTKNSNIAYDTNQKTFVLNIPTSGAAAPVQYGTTNSGGGFVEVEEPAFVTITNTYTEPKNAQVTNKEVVVTQPEGALKTAVDAFAYKNNGLTVLYPTGNGTTSNTLEVPYGTTEATLLYKITVYAGTQSDYTFEDVGASLVYAENATVTKNNNNSFNVTFDNGAEYAYVYVAVTHVLKFTGGFCEVLNSVVGHEAKTTVTEKAPNSVTVDFSRYVYKKLTVTGDKAFTGATFEATLDGTYTPPTPIISSLEDESAIATYAHAVPGEAQLHKTLTVSFDANDDLSNPKAFNGTINFNAEGTYEYTLKEVIPEGATGYDTSEFRLRVIVTADSNAQLQVARVAIWYNDQWETIEGNIQFENTIDTGKDDYYPIIIPTIINKDTGMLNKTDHFAYVIGYPDGTVHPNGQITRAEVATIFFRLLRDEVRDGAFTTSNTYSDVAYGKWYNNPISTMSALGIITGYPDGTFKPNKPITRAEFAAIAARFDETQSGKSATFSDVIGHWAAKEIGIAYYNDWIKGYPDGTFKPDQNITRAEAMTLINRVLERKPESPADLLTNMNKWTDNLDTSKWYYLDVQEATNSHGYTRKTFNYELWRQMLPDPDWSRYER